MAAGRKVEHAPRVVIGVTGGIAAYKAAYLVRLFVKAGADVHVIPTPAALEMVGATTWEALTHHPVLVRTSEHADEVAHVRLGKEADLVVVAPATANTIAKARVGIADNLLLNTLLVAQCPVVMAPAMHTQMWEHPATQENIAVLQARGVHIIPPASGQLTGADSGPGRLPEPEDIFAQSWEILTGEHPDARAEQHSAEQSTLRGRTILVTAGGTHEALDPVRFIGNRSSGRFGLEIARALLERGARVTVLAAHVARDITALAPGAEIVPVSSARDLHQAVLARVKNVDGVVMSAAVADFRPAEPAASKQKKDGSGKRVVELVENPDILADISHRRRRSGQLIVGFAAETGDANGSVLDYGREKARRKGADLLVINRVGEKTGFGEVPTEITVVTPAGEIIASGAGSKAQMAGIISGLIADHFTTERV